MAIVVINNNNNKSVDKLIRKFKKKVKDSKILQEYVETTVYEKPSDVKRKNRNIGLYRSRIETKKNNE